MEKLLSSPSTLAFVGDAYFGLLVRIELSKTERPLGELHKESVKLVNANAQAKGVEKILPLLTEQELSAFKRGRNAHTKNTPKNSSVANYHAATGLECLFGFLLLTKNEKRAQELFKIIWDSTQE